MYPRNLVIQIQMIRSAILLMPLLIVSCVQSPKTSETLMETETQAIDKSISKFHASNEISHLEDAVRTAEALVDVDQQGRRVPDARNRKTRALLQILREVEQSIDPDFDPGDAPSRNVAPPAEAQSRSGVDPRSIKDDKLRAEYEAAIAGNIQKIKYYNHQTALRRIREEFQIRILNYLRSAYSGLPEAKEELSRLVDDVTVSKVFAEMIESAVR